MKHEKSRTFPDIAWCARYRSIFFLIAVCGASWCVGCGGGIQLTSQYKEKAITVDGESSDWVGIPPTFVKENLAVTVCNDNEYLYLSISTGEREIAREIMSGGFTVWFDPEGGSKKFLGIHFPMSMRAGGFTESGLPGEDRAAEGPPLGERVTKEMEILGPGEQERSIVPLLTERQVQVALGSANGRLVYELRVPMTRDGAHPYGIGLTHGALAGIGLEAAAVGRGAEMRRPPEGEPGSEDPRTGEGAPGVRAGGGRRHGGGPGGMQGGRGSHTPLDIWMKARTALQ